MSQQAEMEAQDAQGAAVDLESQRADAERLAAARLAEEGFSAATPDGVTEEEVGSLKETITRQRDAIEKLASRAIGAENELRRYKAKYGNLED